MGELIRQGLPFFEEANQSRFFHPERRIFFFKHKSFKPQCYGFIGRGN